MAEDNERYEKVWFCRVCKKTIKFEAFACKHELLHGSRWKIPSINKWCRPKKKAVPESKTTNGQEWEGESAVVESSSGFIDGVNRGKLVSPKNRGKLVLREEMMMIPSSDEVGRLLGKIVPVDAGKD
jgi:hypothetical protein